ncbi:MAG: hypothetical protein ACPGVD_06070 [Flavobacteriales bacterium]
MGSVILYWILAPKNNTYFEEEYLTEVSENLADLKIYKNKCNHEFYEFRLVSKDGECPLGTEYDSIKKRYFFSRQDIPIQNYELKVIPFFDTVTTITFPLFNDTSFELDTSILTNYSRIESSNSLVKALNNKDSLIFNFRESSCYSNSRIRYNVFHSKNKEIIQRIESGTLTDSMSINETILISKLRRLIRLKENPRRENLKTSYDKKGNEIVTIEYVMIAGYHLGLDIEINKEVYSFSLSDFLNTKDRDLFEEFCNSFFQPKMIMKI